MFSLSNQILSQAIQKGDELIEVNGKNIKGLKISEAIPLLKSAGKVVKLKLSRYFVAN